MKFHEDTYLFARGPGLPDYLSTHFSGKFHAGVKTVFYTQAQSNKTTIDELIQELDSKVEAGQNAKIYLVGHSWGGILAVEYARRNSAKLSGLVAIDTPYDFSFELDYLKKIKEIGISENDSIETHFLTKDERAIYGKNIKTLLEQTNESVFESISRKFLMDFNFKPFLASTHLPILNIFGSEDIRVPAATIRSYKSLTQRSDCIWVEIQDAGHFPFLLEGHNRLVVSEIEKFISSDF